MTDSLKDIRTQIVRVLAQRIEEWRRDGKSDDWITSKLTSEGAASGAIVEALKAATMGADK